MRCQIHRKKPASRAGILPGAPFPRSTGPINCLKESWRAKRDCEGLTRARQPATPVIGFLDSASAAGMTANLAGFHQGLSETPRYLAWFFRHTDVWEQSRLMSTGSAALSKLTLNPPKFLQLEMPRPSMEEQSRIAGKIDAIAGKLSKAKDIRVQAKQAAQSLIWSICEFYLKKCSAIAAPQPLQRLVDPDRGISYGVVQTGKEYDGGIPTLRAGDLRWFALKTDNIKKVDPAIEEPYRRTRLRGGELLLRIRGGVGELGYMSPRTS
jgi:hypothetical protein